VEFFDTIRASKDSDSARAEASGPDPQMDTIPVAQGDAAPTVWLKKALAKRALR
jgi:hypothetical protein